MKLVGRAQGMRAMSFFESVWAILRSITEDIAVLDWCYFSCICDAARALQSNGHEESARSVARTRPPHDE